jgi:hypothetical protein
MKIYEKSFNFRGKWLPLLRVVAIEDLVALFARNAENPAHFAHAFATELNDREVIKPTQRRKLVVNYLDWWLADAEGLGGASQADVAAL